MSTVRVRYGIRRRMRGAMAGAAALLVLSATAAGASNDKFFAQQWNLTQIGAPDAWAVTKGAGVLIGVVDSGVDASHPDLAGKIDASADCTGGTCREGPAPDKVGHGTAVAGIAAAKTDNGAGIAGVAPDAHLVVAKALGDTGIGVTEDINRAIQWVVDKGARIVNLSLGESDFSIVSQVGTPLRPGIEYAWSRGAIPVLAAGNYESLNEKGSSANYGDLHALVVGATDKTGKVADYSTSLGNAMWGLVAPGGNGEGPNEDIISPLPSGKYDWVAGTSMSAPHVSGVLALLLAEGLSPSAAVDRILGTLDGAGSCGTGCRGRLNAKAAVAPVAAAPSTTSASGHAPSSVTSTTAAAKSGSGSGSGGGRGAVVPVAGSVLVVLVAAAAFAVWRLRRNESV